MCRCIAKPSGEGTLKGIRSMSTTHLPPSCVELHNPVMSALSALSAKVAAAPVRAGNGRALRMRVAATANAEDVVLKNPTKVRAAVGAQACVSIGTPTPGSSTHQHPTSHYTRQSTTPAALDLSHP